MPNLTHTIPRRPYFNESVKPKELFNVADVTSWCPSCFIGGLAGETSEDLKSYLTIMQRLYTSKGFLYSAILNDPEQRVFDPGVDMGTFRRLREKSAYLSTIFPMDGK